MIRVFLCVFLLINMGAQSAWSQEESSGEQSDEVQYDEAKDAEISMRARKRLYPGGRDEEDLKIQAQLATPTRKLAPQAEVKDESVEE